MSQVDGRGGVSAPANPPDTGLSNRLEQLCRGICFEIGEGILGEGSSDWTATPKGLREEEGER